MDTTCMIWTWSISIEFQFYFITPWIIYACCRSDGSLRPHCFKGLLAIALLVQAIRTVGYYRYRVGQEVPHAIINKLWTLAHTYLCGIAACLAHRNEVLKDASPIALRTVDVVCVILTAILSFVGNGTDEHRWIATVNFNFNILLLLFSQIIFAVITGWLIFRMCTDLQCTGYLTKFYSSPVWVPIARLSFSAYLLQFIGVAMLKSSFDSCAGPSFFAWVGYTSEVLVVTFMVAAVHYLLVEAPSLRLRKALTPAWVTKC